MPANVLDSCSDCGYGNEVASEHDHVIVKYSRILIKPAVCVTLFALSLHVANCHGPFFYMVTKLDGCNNANVKMPIERAKMIICRLLKSSRVVYLLFVVIDTHSECSAGMEFLLSNNILAFSNS